MTLQSDGKSFKGRWAYDRNPAGWAATWNGSCVGGACLQNAAPAPPPSQTYLHLKVIGADAVVTASPQGAIYDPDCPGNVCIFRYAVGSVVTLNARGSFAGWAPLVSSLGAPCSGAQPTCTFTLNGESAVKAVFSPVQLYLKLEPGRPRRGDRAELRRRLLPVRLRHQAVGARGRRSGYHLASWSGICDGARGTVCNVAMNDNRAGAANFVSNDGIGTTSSPITVWVPFVVSAQGTGTVSGPRQLSCPPKCSVQYERGRQIVLAAAATGSGRFVGWTGICAGSGSACVLRASAPPAGGTRRVAAQFSP